MKALEFASNYTTITHQEQEIILQTKDTLLFHEGQPWQKKDGEGLFDVTMGSWDGAESCELVGTYVLNKLKDILPKEDIGLYRDDGLGIIHKTPKEAENIKKRICKAFKDLGLKITISTNAKIVDNLDVTLDLRKKEYKPYSKLNDKHLYVHRQSNHPPTILKHIPKSIQNRLSTISSNKKTFDEHKATYEEALSKAGHTSKLQYEPRADKDNNTNQKRKRGRNITWFCPPYNSRVTTDIGRRFLSIVDKNFPRNRSKLNKIFNRNTLKLSYSCTENIETIIKHHNRKILKNEENVEPPQCKCRNKNECPLPGNCEIKNIVYEATIQSAAETKTYIGLTANTFKDRYTKHKSDCKLEYKKSTTALSKHVWSLKNNKKEYSIKWKVLKQAKPYNPSAKKCHLCSWEKVYILLANKDNLNKKSELISTCKHSKKYLLSQLDTG